MRWNEEKEEKFCFNIVTTIDDHLSLIHPNWIYAKALIAHHNLDYIFSLYRTYPGKLILEKYEVNQTHPIWWMRDGLMYIFFGYME